MGVCNKLIMSVVDNAIKISRKHVRVFRKLRTCFLKKTYVFSGKVDRVKKQIGKIYNKLPVFTCGHWLIGKDGNFRVRIGIFDAVALNLRGKFLCIEIY